MTIKETVLSSEFYTDFFKRLTNQKLEERMRGIVRDLDSIPFDIVANRELDKFYYMQKLEELRMLDSKLQEAVERVQLMVAARYDLRREIMLRWKKDVKWLATRGKEAEV